MKRYFRLLLTFASIGLKRYLEHRWNTFGYITSSLGSLILSVLFIQIYYNFTGNISGWNKNEALLVLGLYRVVVPIFSMLCLKGIMKIPNYITSGELDIFLSRPINSQFYLSFSLIRIYDILSVFSGLFLVIYVMISSPMYYSAISWLALLISLIAGIVILYSISFCIATLSIWFIKFESIFALYDMVKNPLTFPTDFFGKNIQLFMTFVIPMTFILTVPTKIFLGKLEYSYLLVTILVAIACLKFSSWFWNFALRHYTSASS